MKRIAMLTIAILSLTTAARADDELLDYTDKSITCDKDVIEAQMQEMVSENTSLKVIYVKDISEFSRTKDELRCRVTLVLSNNLKQTGYFRFVNQDGHALVGFKAR